MAKKATKAQIEQRVMDVYKLILADTPHREILRYVTSTWGVKARMGDHYIQKANVLIAAEAQRLRTKALDRHLAQRALLRNKAFEAQDNRLAFDVLRDESKLLGLYPDAPGDSDDKPLIIKVIKGVSMDDL